MQTAILMTESDLNLLVEKKVREMVEKERMKMKTNYESDEIMSVSEASDYLGITEEGLRKARRLGRIEGLMINEKMWGFRRSVLDKYLRRHKRDEV